jgi:amino acid adenylation domain-containing protein
MNTVQFLNQLQEHGIQLWLDGDKLRFRAPSEGFTDQLKAELAQRKPEIVALLRQRQAIGEPRIERVTRDAPIPLTFAQQRLWFLDQFQPGVPAYNVCDAIELAREIDVPALRRAATELVRRHELLRTSFPSVEGVPVQHIAAPYEFPLAVIDLSDMPAAQRDSEAFRLASEEARRPFDLANGPLLRLAVVKLEQQRYLWLLSIHHIVSDDWSKKLLSKELEVLYEAFANGRPSPLPELAIQWADFAVWQHKWLSGENLQSHIDYWKQVLSGELPTLNLPFDRPRKPHVHGEKGKFFFPPALTRALRGLCEAEGVTLYMAVLAGYACLLAHYTRQDDIIIGSPISDRSKVETEGLIGFMLNTLPMRVRVDRQATFRQLLRQVKETCLGAYNFQAVPYESLMQQLSVERDTTGNPLFRSVLTLLNTPRVEAADDGLWGREEAPIDLSGFQGAFGPYEADDGNGTTMFDFSITLTEKFGNIWGKTEHNADILNQASVAGLVERFQLLLHAAAEDPMRTIGDLPLQTQAQRAELLDHWSTGPQLNWETQCLHQFVERQALLRPDAIAIEYEENRISYGQLNAQANRLARYLRARGVEPEARIGVYFDRSIDMFVSIMAVLKTGAAYVPLDVAYPLERIAFILDDAQVELVMTTSALSDGLPASGRPHVLVDREANDIAAHAQADLPPLTGADGLACILYTSGSSGRPKGVGLTHYAQVSYIEDTASAYGLDTSERILQFASIAFDASLEESYLAFARGGTLVLRGERMLDSIDGFVAHCQRMNLSMLVLPTVYWHELVASLDTLALPLTLRRVIIGGERALPEKMAQWQEKVAERIALFNTYGPTEATISVTRYQVPPSLAPDLAGAEVPIGKPVANTTVYVLDPSMEPVPPGIPGEVFIGGLAVARGYFGKPALTAEKFVPDPFSATPGARLYRTGDLARFLPDGHLQYRGRADDQVKIRGYRIELREVELLLQDHPAVEDVVVLAREDEPGERRLVAYVVPRTGASLSATTLRVFLKPKAPSYMIPAAFVLLPTLPRNANGKVSQRELPRPDAAANDAGAGERVAARTPLEQQLCDIWMKVLQLQAMGINDNFFDLGGHSLLATRVVAHVNAQLHIDLPLRRLFEAPTVMELALVVEELARTSRVKWDRPTSLRSLIGSLPDIQNSEAAGLVPGDTRAADIEHMLAGLEQLADWEIEALLGSEGKHETE